MNQKKLNMVEQLRQENRELKIALRDHRILFFAMIKRMGGSVEISRLDVASVSKNNRIEARQVENGFIYRAVEGEKQNG